MNTDGDRLVVIWSSGDPGVAKNLVFMYTKNSRLRDWWQEVLLVIWGPSAKLLAESADLQAELASVQEAGVEVIACKACADNYSVSANLEDLGIEVKYMGVPLTDFLKAGEKILTF